MSANNRPVDGVLDAHVETMAVEDFRSRTWCQDCNATVTSFVIASIGYVDVKHDPTCPAYRTMKGA